MSGIPELEEAISQLRGFISDQRWNPEEASPPSLTQEQFLEVRRSGDPELLKGLAMLPTLPVEIKDELFSFYLSSWNEFVYGEGNSMEAYRTAVVLGEGFAANPNLSLDQYLAIKLEEGETSQNLWNNPSAPPEKIYVIYKHRIDEIDEAANPPSWYHWSNRLEGQARTNAEISNHRSGWGRIQAAIKTQADADRFDAYLEAHP
jgi:DNA-binding transcriptional LysR family regulator